jgi:hypothetical protein
MKDIESSILGQCSGTLESVIFGIFSNFDKNRKFSIFDFLKDLTLFGVGAVGNTLFE